MKMQLQVETRNSTYEIDIMPSDQNDRIRRVSGASPELIGTDREWQEVDSWVINDGALIFRLADHRLIRTSEVKSVMPC